MRLVAIQKLIEEEDICPILWINRQRQIGVANSLVSSDRTIQMGYSLVAVIKS